MPGNACTLPEPVLDRRVVCWCRRSSSVTPVASGSPAQTPPFTEPSRALAPIDTNKSPIFHSVFVRHAQLAVVLQHGHIIHEGVVRSTAHALVHEPKLATEVSANLGEADGSPL